MIAQADRIERAMDQVIELARSTGAGERSEANLDEVVNRRAAFWALLAEEQGRALSVETGADGALVAVSDDELGVVVDTLIDNVFSHTAPGVGFSIATGRSGTEAWLQVADEGTGFGDVVPVRGVSGKGSTGLGLDIVGKTAQTAGGSVEIDDRPGGGAVVRVRFG
jgi:signal transduction histidine kinase